MWNRKELKARGKAAFKANYWKSVLVAFILTALVGGTGGFVLRGGSDAAKNADVNQDISVSAGVELTEEQQSALTDLQNQLSGLSEEEKTGVLLILGGVILLGVLVSAAVAAVIDIFLINPVEVGCKRFFYVNSGESAGLGEVGYAFKNGYGKIVLAVFLRDLFLNLWCLLFVVPAFVKAYSYRMVPYILSENPDMKAMDAITLSRKMMYGQKWKAFVLDLSFLGWNILSILTAGLVGIFYAFPYEYATGAELYKAVRDEYSRVAA